MRVGVVVLAAGQSARMGQAKQLLRLGGETLLRRAVRTAQEADVAPVVVVLGAQAEVLTAELDGTSAQPVLCERWQEGMGASLACGVAALPQDIDAAFVLLCDQPAVRSEHLQEMREVAEVTQAPLIAAAYNDTLGAPCLFGRVLFAALQQIPGDKGARYLIQQYRAQTIAFDLPEAAFDIDTIADYEAASISTSIGLNE